MLKDLASLNNVLEFFNIVLPLLALAGIPCLMSVMITSYMLL